MNLRLEPYQETAKQFLVEHERAAAFMGLGLGKTATTLSALRELMADGVCGSALIVAPLRVAYLTWPNEIRKWDQFKRWRVSSWHHGQAAQPGNVYLLNYDSVHHLKHFRGVDVVVFDELTRLKNPDSVRGRHLRDLLSRVPRIRRWGLTGTPRPNSLLELFAQARMLDDGKRLGRSYDHFKQTWFEPTDYRGYTWKPKAGSEHAVYERIHDLAITLRSEDYLDIPPTVVEDIEIEMPKAARKAYEELEEELLLDLGTGEDLIVAVNSAVLVGKLLQVASGAVYDENRKTHELHNAKISGLLALVNRLRGESLLIASNFIHERERILKAVPDCVDASTFKGDIEDAWNSGKVKYLVADPCSLGHGLNLQTGGRNVCWFSPTYNRELYDQFNARVARKGQGQETRIFRLTCPGTIDDAAIETLRNRGRDQGAMLELLTNFRALARSFNHPTFF